MDVLSSRILVRPSDLDRSLPSTATCWAWPSTGSSALQTILAVVFFLGQGLLEVSGHAAGTPGRSVMIWIQVRDVREEHARLAAAGVPVIREPVTEPWGLIEMWIEDPDGIRIVLVEVPAGHPLRRDPRPRHRRDDDLCVESTFPRKRLVKICTKRFRGNATPVVPGSACYTTGESSCTEWRVALGAAHPGRP